MQSCKKATAIEPILGDISADDWISPSFTIINMLNGVKTNERINNDLTQFYIQNMDVWGVHQWNPQNGDIFFFRGNVIENGWRYDEVIYGDYLAIIPLEENFYWNGVCLYYNGFCYRIMSTENGLRIYNSGLWTLASYCVIVQASSSLVLPENSLNTQMLANIHKLKVKRGHIKAAKFKIDHDAFTPAGLAWGFYKNQGKEIRKSGAGEYIKAEDFIIKTDAGNGYFQSLTSDLIIKKISIYNGVPVLGADCSKVY